MSQLEKELLAALEACAFDLETVIAHNRKPGNKRTVTEALLRAMEIHVAEASAVIGNAKAKGEA